MMYSTLTFQLPVLIEIVLLPVILIHDPAKGHESRKFYQLEDVILTNQQILLANFQGMYSSWRGEFDLNLGRKCMKSMGALKSI